MGYKIVKDNLHTEEEKEYSLEGKEYDGYIGGTARYRLLDDDENVYLYLVSDVDYNTTGGTEEELFAPLDRFTNAYGCTEIQYKDSETGEYVTL